MLNTGSCFLLIRQEKGNGMFATIYAGFFRLALVVIAMGFITISSSSVSAFGSFNSSEEDIEQAEEAINLLRSVLEDNPDNADAYNFFAYSQRNLDQLDVAMENYRRALELDPDHKGALEYQGELFLIMDDKTAAEANLSRLSQLCPRGCEEHEELQAVIERFKDGNISWQSPERRPALGE